jgi:hypothetical protein
MYTELSIKSSAGKVSLHFAWGTSSESVNPEEEDVFWCSSGDTASTLAPDKSTETSEWIQTASCKNLLVLKSRSGETRPNGKFLHLRLKGVLPGYFKIPQPPLSSMVPTMWFANQVTVRAREFLPFLFNYIQRHYKHQYRQGLAGYKWLLTT